MDTAGALRLIGDFTANQWGMITSGQAMTVGVDGATLHRLLGDGHLDRVRHGVYASTSATVSETRDQQAAWLSLNPATPAWERPLLDPDGGVLSHQSAANLHNLGELFNDRIAFTTPRRRTSRDSDLWFKTARLSEADVTLVDSLPVTTPLRTICDLLDQRLDGGHVATIIRQAVLANLVQLDDLADAIAPYARRYGVRPPGNGLRLLEHLLAQVGTSPAELARRPAPESVQDALVALLADERPTEAYHAVLDVFTSSKFSQLLSDAKFGSAVENLANVGKFESALADLGAVDRFSEINKQMSEVWANRFAQIARSLDVSDRMKVLSALADLGATHRPVLEQDALRAARRHAELVGQDVAHDRTPATEDARKLRRVGEEPRAEHRGEEGRPHGR
ncbi:type IV toxin-antitoxin system AbiEi family antitoxin domain-containing protein [Lentzea atacamensis]|nr:type IV toxin-antitoxin system AbiEi family antitoxin domain-containing protein [Lentzea atacamensis]